MMHETGLSWDEIQETPADTLRMLSIYKPVRKVAEEGGELDFPG